MKKRILIKIGGRAFAGQSGFAELAGAIIANPAVEVIIVHGGGAEISSALKAAGRPTEFIEGIRVTRAEDIRIVEQVLSDTVNGRIAKWLTASGIYCQRMSGKTQGLIEVEPMTRGNRDYGYVGQITRVNPAVVETALISGKVPVISPISTDISGSSYNVNADSAAAAIAAAVGCTDLVFITDVAGVLVAGATVNRMTTRQAAEWIATGDISGGMVAKIESAVQALEKGVNRIYIGEWLGTDTLKNIESADRQLGTWIEK